MRRLLHEERGAGLIGSWFIKLFIVLGLLGLLAVDGGAILFAKLRVDDAANAAAITGAATFRSTRNLESARQAAIVAAHEKDPEVKVRRFVIDPDTGIATVHTRQEASTLVVQHIGFLRGLGIAKGIGTAAPPEA